MFCASVIANSSIFSASVIANSSIFAASVIANSSIFAASVIANSSTLWTLVRFVETGQCFTNKGCVEQMYRVKNVSAKTVLISTQYIYLNKNFYMSS